MKILPRDWRIASILSLALSILSLNAATFTVSVSGERFNPRTLAVDAGDTVTWTGLSGNHTVTGSNLVVEPFCGRFQPGPSCTRVFNTPGTYGYYCNEHKSSGMNGIVIVRTNQPPQVSLTAPTNGSEFAYGPATALNVSLSDPNGDAISKVRYFRGPDFLGEATGPFNLSAVLPPGPATLTAVAFDSRGATGTSAPVTVAVQHPSIVITGAQLVAAGGTQAVAFSAAPTVVGCKYVLEAASTAGPGANFLPVRTNTAANVSLPYSEPLNPVANGFWRVRFQP